LKQDQYTDTRSRVMKNQPVGVRNVALQGSGTPPRSLALADRNAPFPAGVTKYAGAVRKWTV